MKTSHLIPALISILLCAAGQAAEKSPRAEGDAAFARLGGETAASLRGGADDAVPTAVPAPVGGQNRGGRIPELRIELRSQKYAVGEVFKTVAYIADTGPDGPGYDTRGWVERTPKYGRKFIAQTRTLQVDVDSSDREVCSQSFYRKVRLPFQSEYRCVKRDMITSIILTINPTAFESTESAEVEACMMAESASRGLRKALLGPNYAKCLDAKKRGKVQAVDQRSFLDAGSINLHIAPEDLDAVCAAPGKDQTLVWKSRGGARTSTANCDPSGNEVSISIALD